MDYLSAVFWQWTTVAGAVFVAMEVLSRWAEHSEDRMGTKIARSVQWLLSKRVFPILIILLFAFANFQLYDQDQKRIRALNDSPRDWSALPKSPDGLRPGQIGATEAW